MRTLDAAYDLYATRRAAFAWVILPLTVPGLVAAFLLTFIPALETTSTRRSWAGPATR